MRPPHRLNLLFAVLVLAAFGLPRSLPHDEGLAGATEAALLGLGLLAAAALVALVQLAATLRGWRSASPRDRLLGLLPLVVLAATGLVIAGQLARA